MKRNAFFINLLAATFTFSSCFVFAQMNPRLGSSGGGGMSQATADLRYLKLDGTNAMTGQVLGSNGTAAAPAFGFASDAGEGIFRAAANTISIAAIGIELARYQAGTWTANFLRVNTPKLGLNSGAALTTTPDVILERDAAATLALRDGANAQTARVYSTYTDASNYERIEVGYNSPVGPNRIGIFGTQAGTGAARNMDILAPAGANLSFGVGGSVLWGMNTTSNKFYPASNNTGDIGSTSLQVKSLYVATSLQGAATKTLTETAATGFVTLTVPNSGGCSGYVDYQVFAADATNTQIKSGQLHFSAVANSTGTVTAATVSDVNTLNPVSAGTLTNTMTSSTAANALTLNANATSSLTQTTLEVRYRVVMANTCTVTGL